MLECTFLGSGYWVCTLLIELSDFGPSLSHYYAMHPRSTLLFGLCALVRKFGWMVEGSTADFEPWLHTKLYSRALLAALGTLATYIYISMESVRLDLSRLITCRKIVAKIAIDSRHLQ